MHQCLHVPEILDAIFSNVVDTHVDSNRRPPFPGSIALVNLALTCQLFKEPALNALWRAIPGFDPVVHCIPHDAVCTIPESADIPVSWRSKVKGLRFSRNIEPKDYARIQKNASRVRVVSRPQVGAARTFALDKLFLHILYSRQEVVGPILPRVQQATLYADDFKDHAIYPRLIIGPSLTSIEIIAFEDLITRATDLYPKTLWNPMRRVLTEAASPIQVFKIDENRTEDGWNLHTFTSPDLDVLLCSFRSLRVLKAYSLDIDHSTFLHFATLPHLEELTISMSSAAITHVVERHLHCDEIFPNLTKFHLNTPSLDPCAELFQLPCAFQCLDTLDIRSAPGSRWDLPSFFESIKKNTLLFNNLSFLKLRVAYFPWNPPSHAHPIDFSALSHLLPFPNISTLYIEGDCPVRLTDDDLAQMGAAWPKLEVLKLPERTTHVAPTITLPGLLPLLSACPHLRELTIRVDATEDVSSFAEIGPIVPHRSLAEFCHCRSTIKDADGVAAFIILTLSGLKILADNWLYCVRGDVEGYPEDPVDQKHRALWGEVVTKIDQVLSHPRA